MSDQGIGKRVKRKEDKRFITGRGRYTDDVRTENQAYAAFVRSPHAHAELKGIDSSAAEAMEGVIAVLKGDEMTADGIGSLICGWSVTSKDGSPMNMGNWRALADTKVRYVGDAVAVVIAESDAQARAAAEMVEDLASDHERIAHRLHALIELIDGRKDPVTEDLATERSAFHESAAWMLRSIAKS